MNQMHSVDSLMRQVEMFACAYATIGGPFDQGAAVENAQKEKAVLREMLTAVIAAPQAEVQPTAVAVFDEPQPTVEIVTAAYEDGFAIKPTGVVYVNHAALTTVLEAYDRRSARLKHLQALINSPELHNFLRGSHLEAVHQVERWGEATDRKKRPADWFWLVGYLAGKALHAADSGNQDKALHHCISTAAALYNWHCAIKGQDVRQLPAMSDVEQIINQAFPGEANAEQ